MSTSSITGNIQTLSSIYNDFESNTCTANEAVDRIDSLIQSHPNILNEKAAEEVLHLLTEKLFSIKSSLNENEEQIVSQLFLRAHHIAPKKIKGLLSKDQPVHSIAGEFAHEEAIIRGNQKYPIPTRLLKDEKLPASTYFKSLKVRLNDGSTVKISSGLLAHYSKMAAIMLERTEMAPPSEMHLDMLNIHQFDTLIAYLETQCSGLITIENAIELLYAADYLQIPALQQACEKFLMRQQDPLLIMKLIQFNNIQKREVITMVLERKLADFLKAEIAKTPLSESFISKLQAMKEEIAEPIHLDLSGSLVSEELLKLLEDFPVGSLNLMNCKKLTPDSLKILKNFKKMNALNIGANAWVSDDVLGDLPEQIETLRIEHCKAISGKGLQSLQGSSVKSLFLFGCSQLKDEDLARLPSELLALDLRGLKTLGEKGFNRIHEMKGLQSIVLASIPFDRSFLKTLPDSLRVLDLSLCMKEPGFLNEISHLKNISNLILSNCPVRDQDVSAIPDSVVNIILVNCRDLTDTGVGQLAKRDNLKSINLRRCPRISQEAIDQFSEKVNVEWENPSPTRMALTRY